MTQLLQEAFTLISSQLTPEDQAVNKGTALWENYRKAKTIRNRVIHSGRKVTADEAKLVHDHNEFDR